MTPTSGHYVMALELVRDDLQWTENKIKQLNDKIAKSKKSYPLPFDERLLLDLKEQLTLKEFLSHKYVQLKTKLDEMMATLYKDSQKKKGSPMNSVSLYMDVEAAKEEFDITKENIKQLKRAIRIAKADSAPVTAKILQQQVKLNQKKLEQLERSYGVARKAFNDYKDALNQFYQKEVSKT